MEIPLRLNEFGSCLSRSALSALGWDFGKEMRADGMFLRSCCYDQQTHYVPHPEWAGDQLQEF